MDTGSGGERGVSEEQDRAAMVPRLPVLGCPSRPGGSGGVRRARVVVQAVHGVGDGHRAAADNAGRPRASPAPRRGARREPAHRDRRERHAPPRRHAREQADRDRLPGHRGRGRDRGGRRHHRRGHDRPRRAHRPERRGDPRRSAWSRRALAARRARPRVAGSG